jgi:DNA-binding NtrC family response regulator
MKRIKILLLNLDSRNESGNELQQVLQAGAPDSFQIKHESFVASEMPVAAKRLSSILSTFSPALSFFVFGSDSRFVMADFFKALRAGKTPRPVIAVVNSGAQKEVAEMLYHGAHDFLIPPFRAMNVFPRVWRCVEETRRERASIRDLKEQLGLKQFIGESQALLDEIKKIPAVARCAASVLIAGETGTGKEICARAIHYLSPRSGGPFVAVNCGAIPPELAENELFGHDPGAFTSALTSSAGLVREAEGGTLFLDEIDSLPVMAQVKLLRLLQEKEFRPLGARRTCKADLRVIAATNADLEEALRAGRFRQDLYYRLNVLTLNLPPLRNRHGDVPLLSRYFVAKFTTELGQPAKALSPEAMQKLVLYEWPGNVRELEHVIERTLILSEHASIQGDEIVLPQSAVATGATPFRRSKPSPSPILSSNTSSSFWRPMRATLPSRPGRRRRTGAPFFN